MNVRAKIIVGILNWIKPMDYNKMFGVKEVSLFGKKLMEFPSTECLEIQNKIRKEIQKNL